MPTRAIRFLSLVLFAACTLLDAYALPPLGLTQITPANVSAGLEIIDGTAYLNTSTGIWTVDLSGSTSFVSVTSPTSVVKAYDGALYFVNNEVTGPVLRRFDRPNMAVTSWQVDGYAVGVDSQLRVLGNLEGYWGSDIAVEFLAGGCADDICVELLSGDVRSPTLYAVTPQGYALGDGGIPGTIGSSPTLWAPDGVFIGFPFGYDIPGTIRDRSDGMGVNIGDAVGSLILLGDTQTYIGNEQGFDFDAFVVVSHGNFAVLQSDYDYRNHKYRGFRGFFPGINSTFPDRSVPLLDIFPQLAAIDIDSISSAASVDGYLYLTIRASDGLYLFGALDPSLVPEPVSLVLLMMSATPIALRRG